MAETGDLLWNQNCSRRIERLEMHYHEHEADAFHWHDRPVFQPWDVSKSKHIPVDAEHGFKDHELQTQENIAS